MIQKIEKLEEKQITSEFLSSTPKSDFTPNRIQLFQSSQKLFSENASEGSYSGRVTPNKKSCRNLFSDESPFDSPNQLATSDSNK